MKAMISSEGAMLNEEHMRKAAAKQIRKKKRHSVTAMPFLRTILFQHSANSENGAAAYRSTGISNALSLALRSSLFLIQKAISFSMTLMTRISKETNAVPSIKDWLSS